MFAIIQTGGKQYRVKAGDELDIERMDLGKTKSLKLDKVLLVSDESHNPLLKIHYQLTLEGDPDNQNDVFYNTPTFYQQEL